MAMRRFPLLPLLFLWPCWIFPQASQIPKEPPAHHPASTTSSSDASLIRAMNDAVHQAGLTSPTYRPGGFTLETSTGKLWWTRVTDSYCGSGLFVQGSVAARLNEINANFELEKQEDGTYLVTIWCANGASCMEDWTYDKCLPMGQWHWSRGSNDYPDIVATFDKSQHYWHKDSQSTDDSKSIDHGPLKFAQTRPGTWIALTGDQVAITALTGSLKKLILTHGGAATANQQLPHAKEPDISVEDTVTYINRQLAANPTPWWQKAGCGGQEFFISVADSNRYIEIDETISAYPRCTVKISKLPVFNLGSHTGCNDIDNFVTGMSRRESAQASVAFVCKTDDNCIINGGKTMSHSCDRVYGFDISLLSDDETLVRVQRAVSHLVEILQRTGHSSAPDPFGQ